MHIQHATTNLDTTEFCRTNKIAKTRSCTDGSRTECCYIECTTIDSYLTTLYVRTKSIGIVVGYRTVRNRRPFFIDSIVIFSIRS